MAQINCCGTVRVFDIHGQSNAVGTGGQSTKPDSLLTGDDAVFLEPYEGICYTSRIVNRQLLAVVDEIPAFQPLQPSTLRWGVELFLGRYLNFYKPTSWSIHDRVVLRKFAAGGTSIQRFLPSDETGFHALYDQWLDEQDAALADLPCPVSYEGLVFIQGEANATQGAANYVGQVGELMAYLQGKGCDFKLIWPQLREDVNGAQAAQLNANMVASQYCTTVSNNDIPMLPGELHPTALGYKELAKRLYNSYIGYPVL